ncbi:MAG TPA: hypothetical protein VFB41_06595 [Solirubrobacteraceae bacterium]|nr:hypothetical protein [Solirubrobacteraceae bacterium]
MSALLFGAWPSQAASTGKLYSVTVSPPTVAAGVRTSFSAVIANPATQQQQVGSVNLTAPSGFKVVSASVPGPATASVSGSTVRLRDLSLDPGNTVTVSVVADAPCATQTSPWTVLAKQANDFNGPPGNTLTLDSAASSLTSSVTGACALRFFKQPANARVGQTVTSTAYTPSGPPVSVEVVDGGGARVTSSTAPISIALSGTGAGPLSGTTPVSAVSGLATFSNIAVGSPGSYVLVASSPGLTSVSSSVFRVDTVAVSCVEDVSCAGSATTSTTKLTVTADPLAGLPDAGFLTISFNVGFTLDCAGYEEFAPADTALINMSADRTKTEASTIAKKQMNLVPNNGASFLQTCLGSPEPFVTRPATPPLQVLPAAYDWDGNGSLDSVYVGLLPDCGPALAPCVSVRKKTGAGDGYIETRLPAGLGDPFRTH